MYDNNVNTNFQDKEIPKRDASYKFFSLIMLDSVVKVEEKYYPQVLLEEVNISKERIRCLIILMMT